MGTIYHCCKVDDRYIPPKYTVVYEAHTEEEAIRYLEKHGGVYRNILNGVEFPVERVSEKK